MSALLPALLMLAAMPAMPDTGPVDPCAALKPGASVEARLVMPPARARDSLVSVAVCVVTPRASKAKIGSYHGELYFDSTAASLFFVEKTGDGMRVENTRLAGRMNFAGAAPAGFKPGALVKLKLRLRKAGTRPQLRLKMLELNGTDGSDLIPQLVTRAAP